MSLITQPSPGVPLAANPAAGRVLTAGSRDLGATLPPFPFNPLLDAPAPRTRGTMIFELLVFLVFVVGGVAWAIFAPLAEASIAQGVVKVEGSRRTIQPLEGGIVDEILVRDGAKVTQGQVLMRLDDIESSVVLETQRAQRWALLAQDARLTAELAKARDITFPPELRASTNARAMDSIAAPVCASPGLVNAERAATLRARRPKSVCMDEPSPGALTQGWRRWRDQTSFATKRPDEHCRSSASCSGSVDSPSIFADL